MDPQYHSPLAEVRHVSQLRPGRGSLRRNRPLRGRLKRGSLRTKLLEVV